MNVIESIEVVQCFKYLGRMITPNGGADCDLDTLIGQASFILKF